MRIDLYFSSLGYLWEDEMKWRDKTCGKDAYSFVLGWEKKETSSYNLHSAPLAPIQSCFESGLDFLLAIEAQQNQCQETM